MRDNIDRRIILLTKTFPFASGEEFVEEEINILASQFKEILVIATAVPKGSTKTRVVPNNVHVTRLTEVSNRFFKYVKYIMKGICSIFRQDIRSDLRGKSILGKLGVIYVSGRCHSLCKRIFQNDDIKELLETNGTILYSYWFSDLPYVSILLKRQIHNDSLKIISRAHGYDLYDYRNASGYIPFRQIVMNGIDKVFPCSNDGKDYLQERFPDFSNKIEVAYLGTKDCGIGQVDQHDTYRIVTCSAIIPLKRVGLVAEALHELEKKGYVVDWTCIGDGPQIKDIKAYVSDKIKKSKVIFTGKLKHNDVLDLLKTGSFDLFVNVSETEGLPVSIMEASSFGIPTLATNVGGTKEIVIPQITGVLLDKDSSASEIAKRILVCSETVFDHKQIRDYWNNSFNSCKNYRAFAERIQNI